MNFEEAYQKFMDGTATEEEAVFVAAEIKRAKEVDAILGLGGDRPVFTEAPDETVQRAHKTFNRRTLVRTLVITLVSLAVTAAVVCGILFIPSTLSAKRSQRYSRQECTQIAIQAAREYLQDGKETEFVIRDVDRHLDLSAGLSKAVYKYEVDLRRGPCEIEVYVSAKTGYPTITDIDY